MSETTVTVTFPSPEAAKAFMEWMDDQGEQNWDYWNDENLDESKQIHHWFYDYQQLLIRGKNKND